MGIFFLFCIFLVGTAESLPVWEDVSYGIKDVDIFSLGVVSGNPDLIYAGTGKSVLLSGDGGKTWE